MFALQKSNRRASARDQIDIKGVQDSVLMLPRNRYRAILSVSPINFELKSEDEQDVIIDTYESFLNSIGFPLQIIVRTREVDMDKYFAGIDTLIESEKTDIYREQLANYKGYVRKLVETNGILTRAFYVIVPYTSEGKLDFDGVKEQLGLRIELVRKGLARLGMSSRELDDLEMLDLFYSFYNPEQAKLQPLSARTLELLHTEYIKKGATNE
jgi:hypothetical protein